MQKIKLFLESDKGKDIMVVIIIILVGLASFELGRLSKSDLNGDLRVEYPNMEANILKTSVNEPFSGVSVDTANYQKSSNFFASSKGSKYYSISCSAGKTIKQENRIYFNSAEEAEKAGYELSSSCK